MRYSEEEIAGFGDLSKLSKQQFVEMPDRKALELSGQSNQKVVPLSEVRDMVEQGWGACQPGQRAVALVADKMRTILW